MERCPPLITIKCLIGIGSSDIIRISKEVFLPQVFGLTDIQILLMFVKRFYEEIEHYIRSNQDEYVMIVDGNYKLRKSILECGSELVRREAADIIFNLPELFVD